MDYSEAKLRSLMLEAVMRSLVAGVPATRNFKGPLGVVREINDGWRKC